MALFDLHVHSTSSDGKLSPQDIIECAKKEKLLALAITDHNLVNDLNPESSFELIPAIELDCGQPYKIHMLGYYVEDADLLNRALEEIKAQNHEICLKIIENLKFRHGLDITSEDVEKVRKGYLTKRNVISILLKKGYVSTVKESKQKYTGSLVEGYIPIKKMNVKEALELIISAGGVPVMAHPQTVFDELATRDFDAFLRQLLNYGLEGLEICNLKEGMEYRNFIESFADKYRLIKTAGSDCHFGTSEKMGVDEDASEYLYPLMTRRRQR